MELSEIKLEARGVRSLLWEGETLVDWVSGGNCIGLDGTVQPIRVSHGFRFDSAVASPSGRFIALFEKLGTKAILLDHGQFLREVNRSYYHADVYEYPITFMALPDGREVLVHCPHDYCRIDIEVAETGECLTEGVQRKPSDIFHSRLAGSRDGKWLSSAGWVWHPVDIMAVWSIEDALSDPTVLDNARSVPFDDEVESVAFLESDRLIVATGEQDGQARINEQLSVFDLQQSTLLHSFRPSYQIGTLVPIG